ncbi:DUF3168 domain-containing protein [Tardiphaga sp.]|uniref:DUF3168 domain-containing protein n=1 Tax=Tardiphaga sp. TaxID=1926292 RepID=UPI002605EE18|nr:DUF3168 domain-containing protein [Tardiphaga sp.]MDB5618216.1 hypothetical protein [Tardiphaga sp.]
MSDPSYALQDVITKRLKADAGVAAIVGQRVFDEVPASAAYPYLSLGGGQVIGDDDECSDGSEVTFQIHGWSQSAATPGYSMVKKIAGAVRSAMKVPLVLSGFDVLLGEFAQVQYLDDPDGRTRHAVIEYRFIIAHP